jgi:hypothetical protein
MAEAKHPTKNGLDDKLPDNKTPDDKETPVDKKHKTRKHLRDWDCSKVS